MTFKGTPKVIHAWRHSQKELKTFSRGKGNTLLKRLGLRGVVPHDIDLRLEKQGALKPMGFPTLVSYHQVD